MASTEKKKETGTKRKASSGTKKTAAKKKTSAAKGKCNAKSKPASNRRPVRREVLGVSLLLLAICVLCLILEIFSVTVMVSGRFFFNDVPLSTYAKNYSSYLRVNGIVIKSSTLTLNSLPLKYDDDFFPTRLQRFYLEVV